MSNWQPIETAPRDGREILLWYPIDAPCGGDYLIRAWSPLWKCWENEYGNGIEGDWFKPTHWMPLPEPPTRQDAA